MISPNVDRRKFLELLLATSGMSAAGSLGFAAAPADSAPGPVADTQSGKVRGIQGKVVSFRGIPYAGSVDATARFLPPGPAIPWRGIRDAITAGPRAEQLPDKTLGGQNIFTSPILGPYFSGGRSDAAITVEPLSENCLVLNVLTPALHGTRPVMVYIHGGGFAQGSGALTLLADRLVAEENIVMVGINHRLNVFGYSWLGDLDPKYADSGNAGQLDLIAALTWVKHNIASFGGDPANVTIFGESGGGAKISCLLAMPGATGLFHRAIIESGSARSVRTREQAAADTQQMLATLGIAPTQLAQLQTIDADKLLAAGRRASPVVDGRSVPHQTWAGGAPPESKGVPLLVGNCKDEATLFSMSDPALFSLDWDALQAREVKAGIPGGQATALIAQYRADYPKDNASDLYFRISADRGARRNAIAQAEAKVQLGDDAYMYNFAWDTPIQGGKLRAFHTSELPLAMRLVLNPGSRTAFPEQIAGAWAGFARSGDPSHPGLPHWDKYTLARRSTMVFDVGKNRARGSSRAGRAGSAPALFFRQPLIRRRRQAHQARGRPSRTPRTMTTGARPKRSSPNSSAASSGIIRDVVADSQLSLIPAVRSHRRKQIPQIGRVHRPVSWIRRAKLQYRGHVLPRKHALVLCRQPRQIGRSNLQRGRRASVSNSSRTMATRAVILIHLLAIGNLRRFHRHVLDLDRGLLSIRGHHHHCCDKQRA